MKPLDHPAARGAAMLLMAGAALWAVVELAGGRWAAAAALVGCAAWAGLLLFPARRLPSVLSLLLVLAALVNAAGYVLSLWQERTSFDEIVHAFTGTAVAAAAAWLLVRNALVAASTPARLVPVMVGLALAAGLAWEAFEWLTGIIGSLRDTMIDLAMDAIGGALGALIVLVAGKPRR